MILLIRVPQEESGLVYRTCSICSFIQHDEIKRFFNAPLNKRTCRPTLHADSKLHQVAQLGSRRMVTVSVRCNLLPHLGGDLGLSFPCDPLVKSSERFWIILLARVPGKDAQFQQAHVIDVHSVRRAPPPSAARGEAWRSVRTNSASTSSAPRAKPSADAPRCAHELRWSTRSPLT